MTLSRRKHIGWEITCDAWRCTATTATAGPRAYRKTQALAVIAAITLAWVETSIGGQPKWVCPLHQTWEPRLDRWVATPLAVRA